MKIKKEKNKGSWKAEFKKNCKEKNWNIICKLFLSYFSDSKVYVSIIT